MPKPKNATRRHEPRGLKILYEDADILVINKPGGLLTIGIDKDTPRTAYYILTDYVRKGYSGSRKRVFVVHRLDRETSGVLIFAKSREAKMTLQAHWTDTEKKYLAVIHGKMETPTGTISTYLAENKAHLVYSTSDTKKGKLAHTAYRVLKETEKFSLLEINLLTGRKHQIRVHFAERGHAIVGDPKYGPEDRTHKRIALHAHSIAFRHPITGKQLAFEAEIPDHFRALVGPWQP